MRTLLGRNRLWFKTATKTDVMWFAMNMPLKSEKALTVLEGKLEYWEGAEYEIWKWVAKQAKWTDDRKSLLKLIKKVFKEKCSAIRQITTNCAEYGN